MKSKITITTLMALLLSSTGFSQTRDDGRPILKSKTSNVTIKAGEPLGEYCGNKATYVETDDNGNTGIMFDIEALAPIRVSAISVDLNDGFSGKVYIHRKLGTHVGSEGSPFNWLLIDSATVTDNGGYTFIPIDVDMTLNTGDVGGLYVRTDGGNLDYKNGTSTGTDLVNDGSIKIKEGQGINGYFGAVAINRQFLGNVYYCTPTAVVCDTATSIFDNNNGNQGIFFDITAGSTPITINQIFADFDPGFIKKAEVHVYTRSGTFVGNESSVVGWSTTSIDSIFNPEGDTPAAVSTGLSISIPANSIQGFYVLSDGFSLDYETAVNVGDVMYTNADITIHTGTGSNGLFTGATNPGRNFNGVIDYCAESGAGLEILEEAFFTISPNPANNSIQIKSDLNTIDRVTIMDQHGKVVYQNETNNLNIDVSMLQPSVYFVVVESDQSKSTKRFVKL